MDNITSIADLTIVVPAYKAADTIAATLQSLQIQTDKRFEVMVVQDGPDDELYKVIDENRKGLQLHHIVLNENGGCGHARNVTVLLDKFGFDQQKIIKCYHHVMKLSEELAEHRVSIADLKRVLLEEYQIDA